MTDYKTPLLIKGVGKTSESYVSRIKAKTKYPNRGMNLELDQELPQAPVSSEAKVLKDEITQIEAAIAKDELELEKYPVGGQFNLHNANERSRLTKSLQKKGFALDEANMKLYSLQLKEPKIQASAENLDPSKAQALGYKVENGKVELTYNSFNEAGVVLKPKEVKIAQYLINKSLEPDADGNLHKKSFRTTMRDMCNDPELATATADNKYLKKVILKLQDIGVIDYYNSTKNGTYIGCNPDLIQKGLQGFDTNEFKEASIAESRAFNLIGKYGKKTEKGTIFIESESVEALRVEEGITKKNNLRIGLGLKTLVEKKLIKAFVVNKNGYEVLLNEEDSTLGEE